MNEAEWVEQMAKRIAVNAIGRTPRLKAEPALRLPYGNEIIAYADAPRAHAIKFQTDLTITETDSDGSWRPRVVIEAKLSTVTTHDAITYSQKAALHKSVHPYLRYGIMLGNRGDFPLPGRLYRHGVQFDFMISFRSLRPTESEMARFVRLLRAEVNASRTMEKLIYESRSRTRDRYTVFHRRLTVE